MARRSDLRPQISGLGSRPKKVDLRSVKTDFKSVRADLSKV